MKKAALISKCGLSHGYQDEGKMYPRGKIIIVKIKKELFSKYLLFRIELGLKLGFTYQNRDIPWH